MKHTVHKVFSIGAFEKEEQWLNQMAAKGMILTDVGFCRYVFEEGTPGEYIYRLELLNNLPSHAESMAYISFLEDMGIEHVGSYLRWVYFRRKASEGNFDLFSDIDSRIAHYKRITTLSSVLTLVLAILAVVYFGQAFSLYSTHPTSWAWWGDSNASGLYQPFLGYGIMFTIVAALFPFVTRPVRKSLKALLKERRIRE